MSWLRLPDDITYKYIVKTNGETVYIGNHIDDELIARSEFFKNPRPSRVTFEYQYIDPNGVMIGHDVKHIYDESLTQISDHERMYLHKFCSKAISWPDCIPEIPFDIIIRVAFDEETDEENDI